MRSSLSLIMYGAVIVFSLDLNSMPVFHPSSPAPLTLARPLTLPTQWNSQSGEYSSLKIAPISYSADSVLVTTDDTLYLIDDHNQVKWRYSTNGNRIFDVAVNRRGTIYLAVADGLIYALNGSGKEIWSHFMNGSANYTQIKPYRNGFLVVLNMQVYRDKQIAVEGPDSATIPDLIEYWSGHRRVWRKDFPAGARLLVNDRKGLAIMTAATGLSLAVIR